VALGPLASSIIHDFYNDSVRLVRFPRMISLRTGRSRRSFLRQLQTPGSSDPRLMRFGWRLIGPGALMLSRSIAASEGIRRGWPALSSFTAGRWGRWGGWIKYLFSGFRGSRWSSQPLLASVDSPGYNIFDILLSNNSVDLVVRIFVVKRVAMLNSLFFQYIWSYGKMES